VSRSAALSFSSVFGANGDAQSTRVYKGVVVPLVGVNQNWKVKIMELKTNTFNCIILLKFIYIFNYENFFNF